MFDEERLLSLEELINKVEKQYSFPIDKRRAMRAIGIEDQIATMYGGYTYSRIDILPNLTHDLEPVFYKDLINIMNNGRRRNNNFNKLLNYIWSIEKGSSLGRWHCHGAFLWDREYGTNGKQRGWMLKKFLESRMMHDVYGQGIVSGELSYVWVPEPVGNDNVVKEDYISRNRIRENLLYLCKIHREMLQEPNMRLFGTGQG